MVKQLSLSPDIVAGLDIGGAQVSVVVAERSQVTGAFEICNISRTPSRGIRRGEIVDADALAECIGDALSKAESFLGLNIGEAVIAFSGGSARCLEGQGSLRLSAVERVSRHVEPGDVSEIFTNMSKKMDIPRGYRTLQVFPAYYEIDGRRDRENPFEKTGKKLTVNAANLLVREDSLENAKRSATKAGLKVADVIHGSVATAMGTLTDQEMARGAVSINIGAQTTAICMFYGGRPVYAASHPVGGNHITNDIRSVFGVSIEQADSLKRAVSLAEDAESLKDQLVFDEEDIDFSCSAGEVVDVIAARVEEIFEYFIIPAINDVFEQNSSQSTSDIPVVVAGGVAASAGIEPFLEGFLQMPVRLGYPLDSDSMPPEKNDASYSLCCGITRFVSRKAEEPWLFRNMPAGGSAASDGNTGDAAPAHITVRNRSHQKKGGLFHSMVSILRKVFSELF